MRKEFIIALLKLVKFFIPKRRLIPILETIFLNGKYAIMNNLENAIFIPFAYEGLNICVPAERFANILTNIEDFTASQGDDMKFTVRNNKEDEEIRITGEKSEEFPEVSVETTGQLGYLAGTDIDILKEVAKFVSVDELRPALMAVNVTEKNFVATDGHQLRFIKPNGKIEAPFLITPKTISILELFGESDQWSVYKNEKKERLVFGNKNGVIVTQRIVNEAYPEWEKVMPTTDDPTQQPGTVKVSTKLFTSAVKEAKRYANKTMRTIVLKINGHVQVSSSDADFGTKYKKKIAYESGSGDEIVIGLNADYVLNAIHDTESPTVTITYYGEAKPIIFNGNHVVMPVRLNDED